MNINTWNQNKVKIEVVITADTRSEESAQKVFDSIDIDFSSSPSSVSAETSFADRMRRFWNGNHGSVSVDYEVFLPATNNLRLRHKHGRAKISDIEGKVHLDMAHGDFSAGNFGGEVQIELAHGKGTMRNAGDLTADLSHAKLYTEELQNIDVDCSHSTLESEKAKEVRSSTSHSHLTLGDIQRLTTSKSGHDHIRIAEADEVKIRSNHTNVTIKNVSGSLSLDMNHGSCRTGITPGFSEVDILGSHTSFQLSVAEGANFKLDASSQHAGLRYPREMDIHYLVEKQSNKTVKGYLGSESATAMVRARLSHGSLTIE